MKTSSDGGASWSDLSFVYSDPAGAPGSYDGLNLGSVTTVDQSKLIVHFSECGHDCAQARLFSTESTDGGATWSKPLNLTYVLAEAGMSGFFPGPSNGIQLLSTNRVVVPGWYRVPGGGTGSTVLVSDDSGASWRFGGRVAASGSGQSLVSPNEATVADTGTGSILLNMRNQGAARQRLLATSADGGETWTAPAPAAALPDPHCQGAMLASSTGDIFFSNADDASSRANGTLKASQDGGATWSLVQAITGASEPFGYSALVELPQFTTGKDDFGVAYESTGAPVSIAWRNWLQSDDDNFE